MQRLLRLIEKFSLDITNNNKAITIALSFLISASHERVSRVVEGTSKLISGDCGFQKILQGNRPLSAIHAVVLMFTDEHVDQQVAKIEERKKDYTYYNPPNNYLFNANSRSTRKRCEIYSKLTIKIPERRQWRRSVVFNANFQHISHFLQLFLQLALNK